MRVGVTGVHFSLDTESGSKDHVNSYYRGETRSLEYASTRVVNSRYD